MLYRTHKAGGTLAGLLAFEYMRVKGMLVPELNEFVQFAIMYPAISWASTAPDCDHGTFDHVKEKTPANYLFYKLLHLTNPKHRSWQTHSILVTGGFLLFLYALIKIGDATFGVGALGSMDWLILRLIMMGVLVGFISHLILDAMSPAGIWVYPGLKLRFVPKSAFFATGSLWETLVYYICLGLSFFLFFDILMGTFNLDLFSMVLHLFWR